MVRVSRTFTIESDLLEPLSHVNASDLICQLLNKHFKKEGTEDYVLEEIRKTKTNLDALEQRLKLIRSKTLGVKGIKAVRHV